jgi:hypothetical protein
MADNALLAHIGDQMRELYGSRVDSPSTALSVNRAPQSLVASAARIRPDEQLWSNYRFSQETWQRECWRYYHMTPELHYAAEYTGSACSRVRIYVAYVDKFGRVGDEVSDDDEVMAVSDTLFGGPAGKGEVLKAIGANMTIAGECYLVAKSRRGVNKDSWMVLSSTELKRRGGNFVINCGYGPEEVIPGNDIVFRLWTPDPECMRFADSPTRACLDVLSEMEHLALFERSQIDSRLSGAGIYFLPAEMSTGPTSGADIPQSADDVFNLVAQAAKAARTQQGSAAGVVPLFVEIPGEYLQHMPERPVQFESELSNQLKDLRENAIARLARGMNMPPEVLTGTGDMNHFNAWFTEESYVKVHIEPMMNRVCDGLNRAYFHPLLEALGKDPQRYTLAFDTAPLTVRPNRLQDTINLYTLGVTSAEQVLEAANLNPLVAAPSEEEENKRYLKDLVLRDPTLFQIPPIREALGFDIDTTPEPVEGAQGELGEPGPPPPPTPERVPNSDLPTGPPSETGTPLLASGHITYAPSPILAAANPVVRRALELAGGQLLTRQYRGSFPDVAKWDLHTRIKVDRDLANAILDRAFDTLPLDFAAIDVDMAKLEMALRRYCSYLMTSANSHHIELLKAELTKSDIL